MKKLFNRLKGILKIKSSASKKTPINSIKYKYYRNLDELPLWNWIKLFTEKDYKYLIKDVEYSIFTIKPKDFEDLNNIWQKIYDEYVDNFGFTKKYKRVLELQRKIAILKCNMYINDNSFIRNEIRIKEQQLKKENSKNVVDEDGNDYNKQLILIEKWLGSSLDMKQLSTKKYFTYLEIIQDESERIKMKTAERNG